MKDRPRSRRAGLFLGATTTRMEAYAVSTLVNSPQNDSPECIEPVKNKEITVALEAICVICLRLDGYTD